MTNERTPTFRRLTAGRCRHARLQRLFYNLGKWIRGVKADEDAVREKSRTRAVAASVEGVPVSELVYVLPITVAHLRRYIREHGLVDFVGDRIVPQEFLPLELHSIQDLNYQCRRVLRHRALYHLARGYEAEAGDLSRGTATLSTSCWERESISQAALKRRDRPAMGAAARLLDPSPSPAGGRPVSDA